MVVLPTPVRNPYTSFREQRFAGAWASESEVRCFQRRYVEAIPSCIVSCSSRERALLKDVRKSFQERGGPLIAPWRSPFNTWAPIDALDSLDVWAGSPAETINVIVCTPDSNVPENWLSMHQGSRRTHWPKRSLVLNCGRIRRALSDQKTCSQFSGFTSY